VLCALINMSALSPKQHTILTYRIHIPVALFVALHNHTVPFLDGIIDFIYLRRDGSCGCMITCGLREAGQLDHVLERWIELTTPFR
jgi:hypothetical protein